MKKGGTKRNRARAKATTNQNKEGGTEGEDTLQERRNKPTAQSKEGFQRRAATKAGDAAKGPKGASIECCCPEEEETQKQQKNSNRPGAKQQKKQQHGKNPCKIAPEVEAAVAAFTKHIEEHGVAGLTKEFDDLKNYIPPEYLYEHYTKNKEKNRYPDVVCIDASRIVLKTDYGNYTPADGEYIHANWVVMDHVDRKYIAAQAPMDNTIEDFWRMVFQESAVALVVMCRFVENDVPKCAEYWPITQGSYANYGKMFVNNKKKDADEKFDIYTLEVLPDGCSNSHVTKLIHVTNWPDKGVPNSGRAVLRLLKNVKECGPGPAVVHCSAGIGRTGTILAIEAVTTRLFKGKETSVKEVFTQIRNQRASCIQTDMQYLFVYSTVLDYIKAKMPKYAPLVNKFYSDLEKNI